VRSAAARTLIFNPAGRVSPTRRLRSNALAVLDRTPLLSRLKVQARSTFSSLKPKFPPANVNFDVSHSNAFEER
jgi:hypothetical protein